MFIERDILSRVLYIQTSNGKGTGFAVSIDGKEYLITAKHVIDSPTCLAAIGEKLKIYKNDEWVDYTINHIYRHSNNELDVCAISFDNQIMPKSLSSIEINCEGMRHGENCRFLGFPETWNTDGKEHNCIPIGGETWPYPIPFIKRCIMSKPAYISGLNIYYIDSVVNKGFSGAPLIFQHSKTGKLQIAGVCVKHKLDKHSILSKRDQNGTIQPLQESSQTYSDMSVVHPIGYIKVLIERNPFGKELLY